MCGTTVYQRRVQLVAQHTGAAPGLDERGERPQFLAAEGAAKRVVRVAEQYRTRPRCQGLVDSAEIDSPVAVVGQHWHLDDPPAR